MSQKSAKLFLSKNLYWYLGGLLFTYTALSNAAVPLYGNPTSFVGPTFKGQYTHLITPASAFSVLGEVGPRNYRINGTVGWYRTESQLFKISGEYLTQDIVYRFFTGDTRQWVQQGAVGALYQFNFYQYPFAPQVTIEGGYSHAPSKQLTPVTATFTDSSGVSQSFINLRRIAGSNAGFVSPGVSIEPWVGARAGAAVNYDDVRYNRYYFVNGRGYVNRHGNGNAQGFGGTAEFNQQFSETTAIAFSAAWRQPFSAYQGGVYFTPINMPNWTFGVDGNYVNGKHDLPNTYNVGIGVRFIPSLPPVQILTKEPLLQTGESELTNWVSRPAIYLPQVLAVTDQALDPLCSGGNSPVVIGTIANQIVNINNSITVNAASAFSPSSGLTYSVSTINPGANSVSIDPTTGVVTIQGNQVRVFSVRVTASNGSCSASTSFITNVQNIGLNELENTKVLDRISSGGARLEEKAQELEEKAVWDHFRIKSAELEDKQALDLFRVRDIN